MNIIIAPLRGVTTAIYRRVYKQYFPGVDKVMAPFIAPGSELKPGRSVLRDILPENNRDSYPMEPQILGNNPDILDNFIPMVQDAGYNQINWNCGCPAPMVVKKKRGSGILPHPDIFENYLQKLHSFPDFSYTVKVRLGLHKPDDIYPLLPIMEQYECKELTVHPRTADQMYFGNVDLDAFELIYNSTTTPLVYNGDIITREFIFNIIERFPNVNSYMVGRGLLINPFLPSLMKGNEYPDEPKEVIYQFMMSLLEEYENTLFGEKPVLGKMKELWRYFTFSFTDAERPIKKILKTTTLKSFKERVEQFFSKCDFAPPTGEFDADQLGKF